MEYRALVDIYQRLESTPKRLGKTKIIADFLRKTENLSGIVLLLQGRIFPSWDETKIGIASRLVVKAISKATGITAVKIEQEWKKTGDLGLTAQNKVGKKTQATLFTRNLTVEKVFTNIRRLSTMEGAGCVDRKIQLIAELLTSSKPEEARYIIRTLLQDLRVGVGEGSLRDAIVWAFFPKIEYIHTLCPKCGKIVPKSGMKECLSCKAPFSKAPSFDDLSKDTYFETSNEFIEDLKKGKLDANKIYNIANNERAAYNFMVDAVQQAYDITNDFGVVAEIAKSSGIKGLLNQELVIGKPVKVMLALKVNDAKEGLERVGRPAEVEYKLDGFRMQVHKKDDEIKLFTRRLEDVTTQFPDVVGFVRENVDAASFIIDSEAVGYSPKTKKYLPFQSISQRIKRKYNIQAIAEKFPVELNVFDILFYEGKNLLKEPFKKRREILEKIINQNQKKLVLVKKILTDKEKEINNFFKESIQAGNEGLMLKNLDSPYKPGARVGYMVKLKETMENLDLVIIGAEWGEGKRASWLSSYILACRDENGALLEIGRVSTGLKEKKEEGLSFGEMTSLLKPLIISEKARGVRVKPAIIIEVAYEEIQKSPTYASGFALRFPRVVRLRTEERSVEDISNLDYIEELYYSQKK